MRVNRRRRPLRIKKYFYLKNVSRRPLTFRQFWRRLKIKVGRRFEPLRQYGRRFKARVGGRWFSIKNVGRKWYRRIGRRWSRIRGTMIVLRLRRRRILLRRYRGRWEYRSRKRASWQMVIQRIIYTVRIGGRSRKVRLLSKRRIQLRLRGRLRNLTIRRRRRKLICISINFT